MSTHGFRNPDKFEVQPHREYLRSARFPNGRDGFVVEDLDLVLRVFGPNFRTDEEGQFRLVELKFGSAPLGPSKKMTFGPIDTLLRSADPDQIRYKGFQVVRYNHRDWELVTDFRVNGTPLNREQFDAWCLFSPDIDVPAHRFDIRQGNAS